jgi:hypothetical protein
MTRTNGAGHAPVQVGSPKAHCASCYVGPRSSRHGRSVVIHQATLVSRCFEALVTGSSVPTAKPLTLPNEPSHIRARPIPLLRPIWGTWLSHARTGAFEASCFVCLALRRAWDTRMCGHPLGARQASSERVRHEDSPWAVLEEPSPHQADRDSILNRGMQMRQRHLDQVLTELYDLIPDTTFTVGRLQ